MLTRNYNYVCCGTSANATKRRACEVRSELDQLSCKLKCCRYVMQMREIEVSKRELGRYASKKTKTGRSPSKYGRLGSSVTVIVFHQQLHHSHTILVLPDDVVSRSAGEFQRHTSPWRGNRPAWYLTERKGAHHQ